MVATGLRYNYIHGGYRTPTLAVTGLPLKHEDLKMKILMKRVMERRIQWVCDVEEVRFWL